VKNDQGIQTEIFAMQRNLIIVGAVAAVVAILAISMSAQKESVGEIFFLTPTDGATVKGTFKVAFGARDVQIVPAGTEQTQSGHHHLLIDTGLPPLDQSIPKDAQHHHFGGGQTETEITLPPGAHHLQLLLGDHNHIPHDPPIVSKVITVIVEE